VTNNTPVVKKTGKNKEVPIRYTFMQFKPGTTYNDLGYEVHPEGYGVQVSSFFINSNLEKFCQRLKTKGEKNIFIQVIQKDKNNPDAGIIYRVIIGADKDKDKMLKKVPNYMDKGYDAVLRKHLDIVALQ
jgi:cell division septation protein DedD